MIPIVAFPIIPLLGGSEVWETRAVIFFLVLSAVLLFIAVLPTGRENPGCWQKFVRYRILCILTFEQNQQTNTLAKKHPSWRSRTELRRAQVNDIGPKLPWLTTMQTWGYFAIYSQYQVLKYSFCFHIHLGAAASRQVL